MLINLDLKSDEFVIADMEAGIEHFGRGVDKVICRMPMTGDILRAGLKGEELENSYAEIQKLAAFFITKK